MSRRGWVLFGAMGVIWGVPYLLIKVAVRHLEPPVVVFGRTSLAAVVLLVIAARRSALRPALAHWKPTLAFAAVEMAGPWLLLTNAEKRLPSGITGLLVACVPLVGFVVARLLGDASALHARRLAGIGIGMAGVGLLVGGDLRSDGGIPWSDVLKVLVVCVGYASAPFILDRKLRDVPSIGVIALALAAVAVVYAPVALASLPSEGAPLGRSVWAVVGLAVLCTGIAFVVFFELIATIGPDRATLFTFVNPAVAVVLGAAVLDERITAATVGGFALVIAGCWLATRQPSAQHAVSPSTA